MNEFWNRFQTSDSLNMEEFVNGVDKVDGSMERHEVEGYFTHGDMDMNGQLTFDEFQAMYWNQVEMARQEGRRDRSDDSDRRRDRSGSRGRRDSDDSDRRRDRSGSRGRRDSDDSDRRRDRSRDSDRRGDHMDDNRKNEILVQFWNGYNIDGVMNFD